MNAEKLFSDRIKGDINVRMASKRNGIRPQLINTQTLEFFNDFICKKCHSTIHVVNAVSPAFTSSFAIADYLLDKAEKE